MNIDPGRDISDLRDQLRRIEGKVDKLLKILDTKRWKGALADPPNVVDPSLYQPDVGREYQQSKKPDDAKL